MILTVALVAALRLAQDPQANALLDGVALQSGEGIVTLSEYQRILKRVSAQQAPTSAREAVAMRAGIATELATYRLEEQRASDFGLDPAQIQKINDSMLAEERRKVGLQGYQDKLKEEGTDALADKEESQRRLLRQVWEYSALGRPLLGKRATKDATIRPGELRALFEEKKDALAPTKVQLRLLFVASASVGGPDEAQRRCADARERALDGEDIGPIVQAIGADPSLRDTQGLTPFLLAQQIRDPVMQDFAEHARVGDVSEVSPLRNPKTLQPDPDLGYQLMQLNDRLVPKEPQFTDPDVQKRLRDFFEERRRDRVLGRAREELRHGSELWLNPVLGLPVGPTTGEPPAAPTQAPPDAPPRG